MLTIGLRPADGDADFIATSMSGLGHSYELLRFFVGRLVISILSVFVAAQAFATIRILRMQHTSLMNRGTERLQLSAALRAHLPDARFPP
ncbi:hypothetical protein [Parapedomonas caeni]